ncbi:MAG: hypothetical protein H0W31_12650 [Actinobacteria bacterium]|nr:hypothetical protein [Actinomycetota bacterium]
MDRRLVGGIAAVAGAVILALSALAEPIGIGNGDGFGLKQIVGVIVGAVAVGLGLFLFARRGGEASLQPHN